MGKEKFRAFISCCVSCGNGRITLYTIAKPIMMCAKCKDKFYRSGTIDVFKGGKLVYDPKTNTLNFVPPTPKPEEAK